MDRQGWIDRALESVEYYIGVYHCEEQAYAEDRLCTHDDALLLTPEDAIEGAGLTVEDLDRCDPEHTRIKRSSHGYTEQLHKRIVEREMGR